MASEREIVINRTKKAGRLLGDLPDPTAKPWNESQQQLAYKAIKYSKQVMLDARRVMKSTDG